MLPSVLIVFLCVCEILANTLRKRTIMLSEGLTMLGFDNNSGNSAQKSSPKKM